MILNAELKDECEEFFKGLKNNEDEQNKLYYTVLYFIHTAPHLSKLYLNWSSLNSTEKFMLNNQITACTEQNGKLLYPPVIRAFQYWDMVQDTSGAPGFNCNLIKADINEETDKNIIKMLQNMEKIISQIYLKRQVSSELLTYSDPCTLLSKGKWQMLDYSSKKRSNLTNSPSDTRNHDDYFSDLNGCGDTTWFSDSTD